MSISISEQLPAHCEHCGTEQTVEAWIVISALDQPALLERVRAGRYPAFTCVRCGRQSVLDTPMLLHRHDQGGLAALIAVPADYMTAGQFRELFSPLVALLFANLGVSGENVTVNLVGVPRLALPAVLARDLRKDMQLSPEQLEPPIEAAQPYRELISNLRRAAGLAGPV